MMRASVRRIVSALFFLMLSVGCQAVGVTPSDCVQVRYITGVWLTDDGQRIAYLVKTPRLDTNQNEYQLYVRDVNDATRMSGQLVFTGTDITQVHWLSSGKQIAFLVSSKGVKKLTLVSVDSRKISSTIDAPGLIDSYSIDAYGDTVAFSVDSNTGLGSATADTPTKEQIATGYRVSLADGNTSVGWPLHSIYIRHRARSGGWSRPVLTTIENPFTHVSSSKLTDVMHLSLSPDGSKLFLTYMADGIPSSWEENPFVHDRMGTDPIGQVMLLYSVQSGTTKLALNMVNAFTTPIWSADSRFFILNAHSPVGSKWEQDNIKEHRTSIADVNVFRIDAVSGDVEEVLRHPRSYGDSPLFWSKGGDIILRDTETSTVRLRPIGSSWQDVSHLSIPLTQEDRVRYLVSNGERILGVHETVSEPQDLFSYASGQTAVHLVTDINPQLDLKSFAPVRRVHWTTSTKKRVDGLLFVPQNYRPGQRYPLVIQTKSNQGWFTCDSGFNHEPSFAAQPLATSGIMYLIRTSGPNSASPPQLESDESGRGYPGGIGEAVQEMDVWDSAVDALDSEGLIDSKRVGIIGFSRTGWHVEFGLVNGRTNFAAATATDNAQYSLSEYWFFPWARRDMERMYGGPPYGASLENWKKYSVSFNVERIHTPLLMEELGDDFNILDNVKGVAPLNLAVRYEITQALSRLDRPFELYFYPNESHLPDHPKARLASLQRNLDWYRFWLQKYERPNPEDPNQYKRWENLLELQDADTKAHTQR